MGADSKMRISIATLILIFTLLQTAVEAIFLGPIAVGVALGAIAVKKGLILGSILSRSRTSHRNGRSYTSYNRRSHYSQPQFSTLLHRLANTGKEEELDVSSSGDVKHQLMILLQ